MTAMAATAEELELQEQVAKTLESQGVMGKIKAQLRVAVFQAIHGNGGGAGGLLASRSSLSTLLSSNDRLQSLGADGQVALELVRNLLECLELDHTLTVFVAEANLGDGKQSEWRQPSRLCEQVGVTKADDHTPVLVKMLRGAGQPKLTQASLPATGSVPLSVLRKEEPLPMAEKRVNDTSSKVDSMRDVVASKLELPPPPAVKTHKFHTKEAERDKGEDEEDGEAELEASLAEEVASGSFEEESLAESASLSHSHNDDRGYKPTSQATQRPGRLETNDEGDDEEESPAIASPPPVPAKLGTMPPLPGMSKPSTTANLVKEESEEEEEEEEEQRESEFRKDASDGEEDLEDDDADAADRLRSLEAKLKEMEAEDDTGVLQQLKVTKLEDDPDEDDSHKPRFEDKSEKDDQEEDDDNYGSDFEEVEEDMDEVASEMSEDIASMSALSESEDVSVTKGKPSADVTQNDKAVDNEDALNSYDYIEAVERD